MTIAQRALPLLLGFLQCVAVLCNVWNISLLSLDTRFPSVRIPGGVSSPIEQVVMQDVSYGNLSPTRWQIYFRTSPSSITFTYCTTYLCNKWTPPMTVPIPPSQPFNPAVGFCLSAGKGSVLWYGTGGDSTGGTLTYVSWNGTHWFGADRNVMDVGSPYPGRLMVQSLAARYVRAVLVSTGSYGNTTRVHRSSTSLARASTLERTPGI
jgi:hypothetical protein